VTNQPYDDDERIAEENLQIAGALRPAMIVPLEAIAALALYCVEDMSSLPQRLCQKLVKVDPATFLMPSWLEQLQERRLWMAAGPKPEEQASQDPLPITAGFHWDHMENIHIVLAGSKEVVLLPPCDALALRATRYCQQAQWHVEHSPGAHNDVHLRLRPMHSSESTSDYGMVSLEHCYAENTRRNPNIASARVGVRYTSLQAGDAIYIPPGWWHSIQTLVPRKTSQPFSSPCAVSVNFWYKPLPTTFRSLQKELLTLEVLSCRQALAGSPRDHLSRFLSKVAPTKAQNEDHSEDKLNANEASSSFFPLGVGASLNFDIVD